MKRCLLLFSLALCLLASCGDANKAYVKKAVRMMDKRGLYAQGPAWEAAKDSALCASPQTLEEAQEIVREALKVAGGKHSFLLTANKVQEANQAEWIMPSFEKSEDGVAIITLPAFSGNGEDAKKYANTVLDVVSEDLRGVVIDLRGNTGGDMYPMISAVHRFLPDDAILRFKNRGGTSPVSTSYVNRVLGLTPRERIVCPVAILTDSLTASSGEAVLICFRGLDNVCVFGKPTAGYASSNVPLPMPDGSKLVLTVGCDVARTGEIFCDDPIEPDVLSDNPLTEALAWIRER